MTETAWPQCGTPDCEKPAKRNHYGNPRQWCSACQKRRETAANEGKQCDVEGCEKFRSQARRYCKGHIERLVYHGHLYPDIPFVPGGLELKKLLR